MATKSTDKTIWTLVLAGIGVFTAWKLLPIFAKKLGSSGGSGSNAVGGAPYFPEYNPANSGQSPLSAGLNFGGGGGQGGGGGGAVTGRNFSSWLSGVLGQGYQNAQGLAAMAANDELSEQLGLNQQIAPIPLQNFDVNQLAFTPQNDIGQNSDQASETEQLQTVNLDTDLNDSYFNSGGADGGFDGGDGGGGGTDSGDGSFS